jgi:hypothetical protein
MVISLNESSTWPPTVPFQFDHETQKEMPALCYEYHLLLLGEKNAD